MKLKLIIGICILFLLFIPITFACQDVVVAFYGDCPYSGDLMVKDMQDNEIAKQFFSTDSGCYQGSYSIEIQGGVEDDCTLKNGERINFFLNDNDFGGTQFNIYEKVSRFNLEADKIPLDIFAVLVFTIAIIAYYYITGGLKKKRKSRKKRRSKWFLLIGLLILPGVSAICEESLVYYGTCLPNGDLIASNLNNSQVLINQAHGPFSGCDNGFYAVELGDAGPGCSVEPGDTILFEVRDAYGIQSAQTEWNGQKFVNNLDLISPLLFRVGVNFNNGNKFKVEENVFCSIDAFDFEGDEITKVNIKLDGPLGDFYEKEFNPSECTVYNKNNLSCDYSISRIAGRKGLWTCEAKYWDDKLNEYSNSKGVELVNSIPIIGVSGISSSYKTGDVVQFNVDVIEKNAEDNVFVKLSYPYSLNYEESTGSFNLQTTQNDIGTHTIVVTADDGQDRGIENLFFTVSSGTASQPPPPQPPGGGIGGPQPPPPPGTPGSGTPSSGTGGAAEEEEEELVNQTAICEDEWSCGEWGECISGFRKRTCDNIASCLIGRHDYVKRKSKIEKEECIIPEPILVVESEFVPPIEEDLREVPAEVKEIKEKKSILPWIGFTLILIGILAGAGYYLMQRKELIPPVIGRKPTGMPKPPKLPRAPVIPFKAKVPIAPPEVSEAKIKIYGLIEKAYRLIDQGKRKEAKALLHQIVKDYRNLPKIDKKEVYQQYMKLYEVLK